MGPCTGHGSGGTRISSAYNIRWQVSIPSFKCVTFGHVIHKLVQHIPKEGGSEEEGDLSFKFHSIKVCNICYLASIFLLYAGMGIPYFLPFFIPLQFLVIQVFSGM